MGLAARSRERERDILNRVQLDVRAAVPEAQAPEQVPRRVYIRRAVGLAKCGYKDQCTGCQHARLGLKPADHSEECRARIVKHRTADDDVSQRVQILKQHIDDTAPSEAQAGERDSVLEPARKKFRFAERVEEQTPEGIYCFYESTEHQQQFQQQGPTWNWRGWSWRLSLTASNDMQTAVFWCKPSKTQIDKIVFKDCKERDAVKKDLMQLGVRSSVHMEEVFSNPGKRVFVHRLGLSPRLALDLRTGRDLNDPAQRAKVWSHLQRERPILIALITRTLCVC